MTEGKDLVGDKSNLSVIFRHVVGLELIYGRHSLVSIID